MAPCPTDRGHPRCCVNAASRESQDGSWHPNQTLWRRNELGVPMSPMHKSITALAASALLATVGFATAQSTDTTSSTSPNSSLTTTTDANGNLVTTTDANAPVNGNQTT